MGYRHTQFGTVIVIVLLIPTISIFIIPFIIGIHILVLHLVLILLSISFPLLSTLTVKINNGILTCYFGIGLIRKRIHLIDVKEYRIVTNSWLVGWGIRWVPGQYLIWNVSGLQAVELVFNRGPIFRIGTDEPEELLKAIQINKSLAA
jgi:hypothetical protein